VPLPSPDMSDEYSTMTPYGIAMGEATFFGNLIRRLTGQRRRDRRRNSHFSD